MYTETLGIGYRKSSPVDNENKLYATTNASKAAEPKEVPEPASPRDTTTISNEAKQAASQAMTFVDEDFSDLHFSVIKTVTAKSGTQIDIESALDPKTNTTVARISFANNDGTIQTEIIKESASLHEDNNGEWQISYYDTASQKLVDYASLNIVGGDKYTIQKYERNISGTAADDIILLLPSSTDKGAIWNINSGSGNDIVIDLSNEISNITTGSGNDTIVGVGANASFRVDSGDGDDYIEVSGTFADARIDAGEGHDTISVKTATAGDILGGKGNDVINIEGARGTIVGGSISGGAGDDKINIIGNTIASNIYGSADDVDSGNDEISISGDFSKGTIDAGGGNNTITIKSAFSSTIIGGSGDDSISIDTAHGVVIESEDGDDNITIRHASESKIFGGNGTNTINITEFLIDSEIYGNSKEVKKTSEEASDKKAPEEVEPSEYDQQIAEAAIGFSERKKSKKANQSETNEAPPFVENDSNSAVTQQDTQANGGTSKRHAAYSGPHKYDNNISLTI